MAFNKKNSKLDEDITDDFIEMLDEEYLNNSDLSIFDEVGLDSLKSEMDIINDAINNKNSIDLSDDERAKLQKDLALISYIINQKSNSNNNFSVDDGGVVSSDDLSVVDDGGVVSSDDLDVDDLLLSDDSVVSSDGLDIDEGIPVIDEDDGLDWGDDLVWSDEGLDVVSSDDLGIVQGSVDDTLGSLLNNYSDETVIKVENLSMDFRVSMDKIDTLKEFFIRSIKRNKSETMEIHALKNISFEISKGDRVGIIGFNGAGKSTLLKLLAGVYYPTEGTIETKGKIAPLLELGAGFDPNFALIPEE